MPPPAATSTTPTWPDAARACWYAAEAYRDKPDGALLYRECRDVEYAIWDDGDRLVVAFAGSTFEGRDWWRNLWAFPSHWWIHAGFLSCYLSAQTALAADLATHRRDRPVLWVGHSQGGATAKLAFHFAGHAGDTVINFGAPPCWTARHKHRIRGDARAIHEYRTPWDTVPRLLRITYGPDTPGIMLPTGRHSIHAYAAAIKALNR